LVRLTVPKPQIELVGHGFSRANTLVSKCFANLKVCPTLKNLGFGAVSSIAENEQGKKEEPLQADFPEAQVKISTFVRFLRQPYLK